MLYQKEDLANKIYGDNAEVVLKFLAQVAPDKHEFQSEKSFLNFIARKLHPLVMKKDRQDKANHDFWMNRAMSLDIRFTVNKAKNVLWCIRLVTDLTTP